MKNGDVPFYVEFKIGMVVMAPCETLAPDIAKRLAVDAVNHGDIALEHDGTIELKSLKQLASIDPAWTHDCLPWGGDDETTIGEILPEEA